MRLAFGRNAVGSDHGMLVGEDAADVRLVHREVDSERAIDPSITAVMILHPRDNILEAIKKLGQRMSEQEGVHE